MITELVGQHTQAYIDIMQSVSIIVALILIIRMLHRGA
jgi:hypothetical protein